MSNPSYLRGRRLEWAIQKLFREAGYQAMRSAGSHGLADIIVCHESNGPFGLTIPIPIDEINEVLTGWMDIHDPKKILPEFLYAKHRYTGRNLTGHQTIHLTPASVWMIQAKTQK